MFTVEKTGRFTTDFYGGASHDTPLQVLLDWIDKKEMDAFMSWGEQVKKKGQEASEALGKVLSVFNRNESNEPIVGGWMLRRCLVCTGLMFFNAKDVKGDPTKPKIPFLVLPVDPNFITLRRNGDVIKKPDKVDTRTVSIPGRSFFKAYEIIKAGAVFTAKMRFDDDILSKKQIDLLLKNCCKLGLGAFRERHGKFEWLD